MRRRRKRRSFLLIIRRPAVTDRPRETDSRPETFQTLLRRCTPRWYESILPGGAVALSFNEYTLPAKDLLNILEDAGFEPLQDGLLGDLRHEVEQAVSRNVIFALKQKEAHST